MRSNARSQKRPAREAQRRRIAGLTAQIRRRTNQTGNSGTEIKAGTQVRRSSLRRHPIAVGLIFLALAAAGGYLYWDYAQHFESTDDAFIASRQFAVAPKVSGYITAVPVTDNQHVVAGDLIARIDDRDYRIARSSRLRHRWPPQRPASRISTRRSRCSTRKSARARRRSSKRRRRWCSPSSRQRRQIQSLKAQRCTAEASLAQAKARRDQAQLNLSYTTVTAAQAGRVVNLTAGVGQFAQDSPAP